MRYLFNQKSPLTLYNDHTSWARHHPGAMAVNTRNIVRFLMDLIVNKIHPIKVLLLGRSQDGGGIGWGDHFLFYKFIERTTEQ